MGGKYQQFLFVITTGKIYISSVLFFYLCVPFHFIISLLVIYNCPYTPLYSTHIPDQFIKMLFKWENPITHNFP